MNKVISCSAVGIIVCFMIIVSGCGGVSHSSGAPSVNGNSTAHLEGRVTLTIHWPSLPTMPQSMKPHLVPEAVQSIGIVLTTVDGDLLAQEYAVRTSGHSTYVATFSSLPAGTVTVVATAYPTSSGTGTALAKGTVNVSVTSGNTTAASVTMDSTIDHLVIIPAAPSVTVGASLALSATALDASGNMVLTTASKVKWTSLTPTFAIVDPNSGVVTGVAVGDANLIFTDSESGKTATTTIRVIAGGSGTTGTTGGTTGTTGGTTGTTGGSGTCGSGGTGGVHAGCPVPEASTSVSTGVLMLGGFGLLLISHKRVRKKGPRA